MTTRLVPPYRQRWHHALVRCRGFTLRGLVTPWLVFLVAAGAAAEGRSEDRPSLDGVVHLTAQIPRDARTAAALGTAREGTGVVIDDNGLILTIGYLILEAAEVAIEGIEAEPVPARIIAYDYESGFGLVRAEHDLDVPPLPLGRAADLRPKQPLVVVSRMGELKAAAVEVVDRREFAGYWEYLLDEAIFTSPPHAQFGGAALLDDGGRLVGIGSLFVNDAAGEGRASPGNMFVPIDHLKPIMADLLTSGRRADPAQPWLGIFLEEHRGRVFVTRVSPGGPAEAAGITADDQILGIGGEPVNGLADFYRKLWRRGPAGIEIELDVVRGVEVLPTQVKSGDRYRYLRLDPSF